MVRFGAAELHVVAAFMGGIAAQVGICAGAATQTLFMGRDGARAETWATTFAAASQEVIKLVTGQFVPAAGTLIYNGITCSTCTLEL
jgi:amyloid beta precursor protein binding protein 1